MTKNDLKQLVKEVLAEQNALTTLQISTVGGGTTLLLYRGDARQTERSSDKAYKTPTQFKNLIASLNTTGGMTTDEVIKNILKKLTPEQLKQLAREKIVVSDRVSEFLGEEASTKELQKLGFKPTKSDVNEGSDYDKMTPQQKHQYSILRDLGWEYDYTENGKVYMNRWDRGSDGFSKLATMVIEPDGNHYREKSVNESPIVRGLIRPDPKSPLEGAVVKRVESHGHYHADMILLTKNNKEIKGRFEFDPHNPPSFYESVNEAGGYEDGIKDAKDRMKYVALRKMEKDHLAKSKITKDIKKQHHLDMADKYLDQAMAIAKKHGVVDEGKMNEVKGFVLHFNTPEADYMRKNGVMKKKMNSTFKQMMDTRTVKYADLLKAFPQSTDIVLKDLPSIPKGNTGSVDYFTVDGEGDVVPLKQGDIGSGLD